MRTTFLLIFITLLNLGAYCQCITSGTNSSYTCLSNTEARLAYEINRYRVSRKLNSIPLSTSLTRVAQLHVRDLAENYKPGKSCNLHSWSQSPQWTSCCYTPNHAKASCMWDKPRELTSYKGTGYEIAYYCSYNYRSDDEFIEDVMKGWKSSAGHHALIINEGEWKTAEWKAMGVGVYNGFAVIWFGEETDTEGKPDICTN